MPTLHARLWQYFCHYKDEWHPSGELQKTAWRDRRGAIATPSNISRRLRELEDGSHHLPDTGSLIAVKYENGHAFYRYIPRDWRNRYIPTAERPHRTSNLMWRVADNRIQQELFQQPYPQHYKHHSNGVR